MYYRKIFLLSCVFFVNLYNCQANFYEQLAFRYAPIHYQDTDDTNPQADFLTRFDYDGNYDATDNWDHLMVGDLSAVVYYSVVESQTHWFILYTFFHPRDRAEGWRRSEHENDLEGFLIFVKKDHSIFGEIQGMITHAHGKLFSYLPPNSPLIAKRNKTKHLLSFENWNDKLHPRTTQEARGHGCYAWPYESHFCGDPGQDGIIYYPSLSKSEVPTSGNTCSTYRLVNFHEGKSLWTQQLLEANLPVEETITFSKWGMIKGNKSGGCGDQFMIRCTRNNVRAPWIWNGGLIALDPAKLVDKFFSGFDNFSFCYLYNPYINDLSNHPNFQPKMPIKGWPLAINRKKLFEKLECEPRNFYGEQSTID